MGRGPSYIGCQVDGCDNTHYAKQYCRNHYEMVRKHGAPERPVAAPVFCTECGDPAYNNKRRLCQKHYQKWWQASRQGTSAGKWLKAEVGYGGAHNRVRAVRGHARDYSCVLCGEQAREWALSVDATDLRYAESAIGRGNNAAYSLDVYSYLPMCSDCHKEYDADHGLRTYKTGEFARCNRD